MARQPTIFVSHGGGPCFWIEFPPPFGPHAWDGLAAYLRSVAGRLPEPPKAILMVSAHWEAPRPTVGTAGRPAMIYDYYGFPEHTYRLNYPAPGSPELGARVLALLDAAGIDAAADPTRGFDHGVFVPLLLMFPEAAIPVVPLSIRSDYDPAAHLALGAALAPLRDEGVLIVGSGLTYHNLRRFQDGDGRAAAAFDAWLTEAVTEPDPARRDAALARWETAPFAHEAHPQPDHLIPLMVAAGAAAADRGRSSFAEAIGGKAMSCFEFG